MKKYFTNFIKNPGTLTSLLMLGTIALIGSLHNHAHYTMSKDADAYVFQWCKANPERCTYRPR